VTDSLRGGKKYLTHPSQGDGFDWFNWNGHLECLLPCYGNVSLNMN
jgi:hypothetical protein